MDCNNTLDFLKELKRMCNNTDTCKKCELSNGYFCKWKLVMSRTNEDFKTIIEIVQKWSDKHPIKTRQSEFLKIFPNAIMAKDGIINLCPRNLNFELNVICPKGSHCVECNARKEYWLQEIEVKEDV